MNTDEMRRAAVAAANDKTRAAYRAAMLCDALCQKHLGDCEDWRIPIVVCIAALKARKPT